MLSYKDGKLSPLKEMRLTTNKFKVAGTELMKGNFGNSIKSLFGNEMINPSSYRGDGGFFFTANDGKDYYFQFHNCADVIKAYTKCAPLTAIINRKVQAYMAGNTVVTNSSGKAKGKEADGLYASKLRKLMAKPNMLQNWQQFEAQGKVYQQLYGYNVILVIKPAGFGNIEASALWNLPPNMLDIKEARVSFFDKDVKSLIESVHVSYMGTRTKLDLDNLFIMKDFTPSFDTLVFPESRLRSLEMPINNIIGAYESRNVLINRRGALGILSSEKSDDSGMVSLSPGEKETLEKDFMRYGLLKNQWQFILSQAPVKWQNIGFATKDLLLFEEIQDDTQRICDSYGYQYELIASSTGTTFANLKEAKKLLYQDTIMPEAQSDYEQWNQLFNTANYNLTIDKTYDHVQVLQEDAEKRASARLKGNQAYLIEFKCDLITQNRWRELNGEEPTPDGNRYYSEIKDLIGDLGNVSGSSSSNNNNDNNNSNNGN